MGVTTLFMIAVGLAMDAFAVSVSDGMVNRCLTFGKAAFIALTFGAFQGLMPLLGYLAGNTFSPMVRAADHWIALVLLSFIGIKMIVDSIQEKEDAVKELFSCRLIFAQGIATSIDALTMGISFAVMQVNILAASSFIAAVTFICSFSGVALGKYCGGLLKKRAQIFGGCVLVLIGVKLFIEHIIERR